MASRIECTMTGGRGLSKKRILIVDDDPDILLVLQERLEADGFAVATALNGREALVKIGAWKPNAILLDLHMPIMNGLEMLRTIRQAGDLVPVLTMTASERQGLGTLSLKAGATACLLKPFEYTTLKSKLSALLAEPSGLEEDR